MRIAEEIVQNASRKLGGYYALVPSWPQGDFRAARWDHQWGQTAFCNQFVVHGWWVNTPVILPTFGALIRERMHSNVPILYRRSGVPQKHVKSVYPTYL